MSTSAIESMARIPTRELNQPKQIALSTKLIERYESEVGHRIPTALVDFVNRYGFQIVRSTALGEAMFPFWNRHPDEKGVLEVLFGMAGMENEVYDVLYHLRLFKLWASYDTDDPRGELIDSETGEDIRTGDIVPFALSAGMPLVLVVNGPYAGRVYYFDTELWSISVVSLTFDDFFASLHLEPQS